MPGAKCGTLCEAKARPTVGEGAEEEEEEESVTQHILFTRPGRGHVTLSPARPVLCLAHTSKDVAGLTIDAPRKSGGYASPAHPHPRCV